MTKVIAGIFLGLLSILFIVGLIVLKAALPILVVSIVITLAGGFNFNDVLVYVIGIVAIIPITLIIATIVVGNLQFKQRR